MPGFNIPFWASGCTGQSPSSPGPANDVETARAHRFILEVMEPMGGQDSTGMLLFLEKCNRPSPEFDKIVIHNGQDEIPRPGKTHWKDVEFTFYEKLNGDYAGGMQAGGVFKDDLEDQCAKLIYEWWSKTMIDVETSRHKPPSEYLKNCQLQMVDGSGEPIWTYFLYDCWPLKVSPSDLDYGNTEIARISVTLAYARAKEKKKGGQF